MAIIMESESHLVDLFLERQDLREDGEKKWADNTVSFENFRCSIMFSFQPHRSKQVFPTYFPCLSSTSIECRLELLEEEIFILPVYSCDGL